MINSKYIVRAKGILNLSLKVLSLGRLALLLLFFIFITVFKIYVNEFLKVLISGIQVFKRFKNLLYDAAVNVFENALQEFGLLLQVTFLFNFFSCGCWHAWRYVTLFILLRLFLTSTLLL